MKKLVVLFALLFGMSAAPALAVESATFTMNSVTPTSRAYVFISSGGMWNFFELDTNPFSPTPYVKGVLVPSTSYNVAVYDENFNYLGGGNYTTDRRTYISFDGVNWDVHN